MRIAVTVNNGQTMSQYWMTADGRVSFHNAGAELLVVTPKSGEPFCDDNQKSVIPKIEVDPGKTEWVKICDAYKGNDFLYTAQIGTANPEDPIVILERGFKINADIAVGAAVGLLVGFVVAYLFLRRRGASTTTG